MYFYIIFPEGLKYCNEIEDILKKKFELIRNIDIDIDNNDINDFFLKYLYKNEPRSHILGKINYLLNNLSNNIIFKIKILLVNDKNERFFNDRGTKKNENIEIVKREIRNKFNPKFNDENKKIFPLNKGISHNHVIHSNDLPEEFVIIKNIIMIYKKYKIFKVDTYHHKNEFFLNYFINKYHYSVNNINDSDIVLSGETFLSKIENCDSKKFIFGPHFGKNRINEIRKINNNNDNIYIQPSLPSVKLWTDELNFSTMPVLSIPFGVDTKRFIGNEKSNKSNIIVYYKQRDPNEMKFLTKFLEVKNIKYKIFDYQKRYKEEDFLQYIKTCKYGIVLGRHESQGFAIQEMLSCDIPLLVWGVTSRKQEYPYRSDYQNIKTPVSTVPYWSNECGELFYKYTELEGAYDKFISNIEKYQPRQFILDNLSMETCSKKWNELLMGEI